jgi:hypothetical protein
MFAKKNAPLKASDTRNDSTDTTPQVVEIRKSRARYVLHTLISVVGLALVIYTASTENGLFSFLTILFVIIFLLFGLFSFRNLLDRTVQIQMTPDGITFNDGACLPWKDIRHCHIERRITNVGKGVNVPGFYLHVETIFSGQVTGYRTEKIFQVTGLEYGTEKIIRLILLYKRKYH